MFDQSILSYQLHLRLMAQILERRQDLTRLTKYFLLTLFLRDGFAKTEYASANMLVSSHRVYEFYTLVEKLVSDVSERPSWYQAMLVYFDLHNVEALRTGPGLYFSLGDIEFGGIDWISMDDHIRSDRQEIQVPETEISGPEPSRNVTDSLDSLSKDPPRRRIMDSLAPLDPTTNQWNGSRLVSGYIAHFGKPWETLIDMPLLTRIST
jgi:hypothetical protein